MSSPKKPVKETKVAVQIIKRDKHGQMLSGEAQRRAFEKELENDLPSFAGLLGKLYRAANNLVEDLDNPDLSPKDKVAILGQLSKSIPLLQQAEANHSTKLKDKDLSQLTYGELEGIVREYLGDGNVRSEEPRPMDLLPEALQGADGDE